MFLNLLDGMQQNIITWSIYLVNFILTIRLSQKSDNVAESKNKQIKNLSNF